MHIIHATLQHAEDNWNIREAATKLRLKELKKVAYNAEDVMAEYEFEVTHCWVEALERSASHKRKYQ